MLASLLCLCGCGAGTVPTQTAPDQASQTGMLSICKETDGGLTGTFSFSSSAFTETQTINVVAGATQPVCGPPLQVPAGTVATTEVAASGTMLSGARTLPEGNFLRLTGSTATFTVMAGGLDAQTLIIFRNISGTK